MARLSDNYAQVLFQNALAKDGLDALLKEVTARLRRTDLNADGDHRSELADYLDYLSQRGQEHEVRGVLERLLELAHRHLGIVTVEVHSAVPLSDEQLASIQHKLILRSKKQVQIIPRVDPGLIAGLRIIGAEYVLDTSVKNQLAEVKEKMYKGVHFSK